MYDESNLDLENLDELEDFIDTHWNKQLQLAEEGTIDLFKRQFRNSSHGI